VGGGERRRAWPKRFPNIKGQDRMVGKRGDYSSLIGTRGRAGKIGPV